MIQRTQRRGVIALLLAGSACAACHGERPDVLAQPVDGGIPGLLAPKNTGAVPAASAPNHSVDAATASDAPLVAEPPVAPRSALDAISASALAAAVAANNAFAVALFEQVRAGKAKENLLTSPLSAELALSMAYAGATGQTRSEMASALSFGATPAQTIFDGQGALSQALLGRGPAAAARAAQGYWGDAGAPLAKDYELAVVNSIWGQTSYPWAAPFLQTLATNYGATLYQEDFRNQPEPARQVINAWVSKRTGDKINDLLPRDAITRDTRIVLVNALHLKLPWETPFRKEATAPAPFTRADKTKVSARFMNSQHDVAYADDGRAQIVSLPLVGNDLALIIALPHAGSSLEAYEHSLRAGSAALTQPKKTALVKLSLPKSAFTSTTFSLRAALMALGMKQAFDEHQAHFEGMCPQTPENKPLYVSDVLQKAMIEVQETGVEAAAATAVLMMVALADIERRPEPKPVPMIVNRPYLIAVLDIPTGTILMLGHITDPSQAPSH